MEYLIPELQNNYQRSQENSRERRLEVKEEGCFVIKRKQKGSKNDNLSCLYELPDKETDTDQTICSSLVEDEFLAAGRHPGY